MSEEAVPAPSDRPVARSARSGLVVLGVAATLVAILVGTLIIRGDGRPRAEVGDVVFGPSVFEEVGQTTEVLLPWARVNVTIGEPVEELPPGSDERPELLRPPSGGSFIRVAIKPTDEAWTTMFRANPTQVSTGRAVLTAGGRDYPLDPAGFHLDVDASIFDFGGAAWVAVDGTPQDASVAITADGATQVIADGQVSAGRAAELVDLPTIDELEHMPTVECEPISRSTRGLTVRDLDISTCLRGMAVRTPYVDGLGWAKEGRDFLVVYVGIDHDWIAVGDAADSDWEHSNTRLVATLDGAGSVSDSVASPPGVSLGAVFGSLDSPRHVVFDVPSDTAAGDLELALSFDAEPTNPRLTDRRQIEFRWRVASGDSR